MTAFAAMCIASWALTGPQLALPSKAAPAAAGGCRVADCLVSPKQRAEISAGEAGLLTEVAVQEGDVVADGQSLAVIDDRQARIALKAAQIDHESAREQATNDVNERFAVASKNVALAELWQAEEANKKVRDTVSPAEVRRRQFAVERATLQIEQARMERKVANFTMHGKAAEAEAAQSAVERRQVPAPFAGLVVEVKKQRGEWVQAGEPLCRLLQLDQMYVEGLVRADDYLPSQLAGRPVEVLARITANQTLRFKGQVIYCSPEVDPINGLFRVKAVVDNQKDGEYWLLRPGLQASMIIDLGR